MWLMAEPRTPGGAGPAHSPELPFSHLENGLNYTRRRRKRKKRLLALPRPCSEHLCVCVSWLLAHKIPLIEDEHHWVYLYRQGN